VKTRTPKIDLLRTIPGLTDLGDRDLGRLAPLFDDVRIDAGRVLAREGQSSHELVLIVEGWAALSRRGKPIDSLGPGQLLGEMSILDRAVHTATATAQTPMRILLAGRQQFATLRDDPNVLRQIAMNLAGRLRSYEAPVAPGDPEARPQAGGVLAGVDQAGA
jgi:CRP/FNR family transcriptional regulator, cyclic AMP receptor protein